MPSKYISFKAYPKFKIGVYSECKVLNYDMMFKLKVKTLEYFIGQIIHYLDVINKNN